SVRTEEPSPRDSFRMYRMINKDSRMDFSWRPSGWELHCAARGDPEDSHPVAIQVLLREPPDARFLEEVPRRVGTHPIRYEHRHSCLAYSPAVLVAGANVGRFGEGRFGVPRRRIAVDGTLRSFLRRCLSRLGFRQIADGTLGGFL